MEMHRPIFSIQGMVYTALAAVVIAVCSWISIPTEIPFTLQTFAIFCILPSLGGKRGTMSILIYLLLGALGAPVFAHFTSGIGILLGNTGGYMLGFVFIGIIYWVAVRFLGEKLWIEVAALTLGLLVCYAFGTAWYMIVYAKDTGAIGIATALSWCVLPFILPDAAKLTLALFAATKIRSCLLIRLIHENSRSSILHN